MPDLNATPLPFLKSQREQPCGSGLMLKVQLLARIPTPSAQLLLDGRAEKDAVKIPEGTSEAGLLL